ncbi:MAG: hemolysin family protein [candidate division WOR-3 bacterium]
MFGYLAAVLALLVLSALFSGAEAALFSLTPTQRDELRRVRPGAGRRVEALLADSERLLATLLVGNLVVNTTASALFTLATLQFARAQAVNSALAFGLGGVLMTLTLLVFGEVAPKVVATRSAPGFAILTAPLVLFCRWLLRPVAALLVRIGSGLARLRRGPDRLSDDELLTMVEIGRERGILVPGEEEILTRLIGLEERTVSEVMTPRTAIAGIEAGSTVRDAIATARAAGFSRLPVYEGTPDRIVGIVYSKELLTASDPAAAVTTLCRPPFFVPEVKRLTGLLDELRRKGSHIAIVVDEFGQTAGLVTLEDLLEAIFGEISDESDLAEELPYCRLDDSSYLVDGEIDIATINRLFGNALRSVSHERLSALIQDRLSRVPVEGDTVRIGGLEATVRETDGNRLEKVLIRRVRRES